MTDPLDPPNPLASNPQLNVEHSRHMAEGISDPCIPMTRVDETWMPVTGGLAEAGHRAGWSPREVQQPFTLAIVRQMIACARRTGLLPVHAAGDPNAELYWSTWRAIISSFGFAAWAELIPALLTAAPDCPFTDDESFDDWHKAALDARQRSGVPLSFARIPWTEWARGERPDCWYLGHVAAWHIIRHVYLSADSSRLYAFYHSHGASLRVDDPVAPLSPLTLITPLRDQLALPDTGGKKTPDALGIAAASFLRKLIPEDFFRQKRPIALDPHIMPGPGARLAGYLASHPYFAHGARLEGVAACVDGVPQFIPSDMQEPEDVLAWEWLRVIDHGTLEQHEAWAAALPDVAPDGRPTEILRAHFPNLKFQSDDHACLVDAILVCDLIRRRDGSPMLRREFPLLAILPYTPTTDGSTNTGKTALVDTIAKSFDSRAMARTIADESAPTKRAIAADIKTHGFTALDEWKAPSEGSDHLLRWSGMQTLCTGGAIECGKAYSNESHHIRLASPIVLNAKYLAMPPDMLTRTIFMWVEPRGEDAGPEVSQRWDAIVSGRMALDLRLAALRMLDQWPDIDAIGGIAPGQHQWRMVGHRVCAARICAHANGIPLDAALARIDAAVKAQAEAHQQLTQAAIDSGLVARYENPSSATLDIGSLFDCVQVNADPKHRADQLLSLIARALDNTLTTAGKADAFSAHGLAKAFANYLRNRDSVGNAGRTDGDVLARVLGPKFQGVTDKDLALRMREALSGACPGEGRRWSLPGLFGVDGWYVEAAHAGANKLFRIGNLNAPNP